MIKTQKSNDAVQFLGPKIGGNRLVWSFFLDLHRVIIVILKNYKIIINEFYFLSL